MARLSLLLPPWETHLAADRGARPPGYWCQAGVGGQVGSGAWRSLSRVWASKDGGGRDP